jgi:hypothetical protein
VVTSEDREHLLALKARASEQMPAVARFLVEEIEREEIPSSAPIASSSIRRAPKFIDHRTDRIQHGILVYP